MTVAYDPVEEYASMARDTVQKHGLGDRVRVVTDLAEIEGETFDSVACLSVMEHMPLPQRTMFYDLCARMMAPGATGIVEVPVEVGPALVVKELGRRILKGREKEYSNRELLRRGLGRGGRDAQRYDPSNSATWIQHHTSFDYRSFMAEVAERFEIIDDYGAPLPKVPSPLGNQEHFVIFRQK